LNNLFIVKREGRILIGIDRTTEELFNFIHIILLVFELNSGVDYVTGRERFSKEGSANASEFQAKYRIY